MCKLDEILIRVRSLEEQLEEKGYHDAPKVIVAGGRDFNDYEMMRQRLFELFNNNKFFAGNIVKIISGMADGADTLAIRYADENRLPKIMMPASARSFGTCGTTTHRSKASTKTVFGTS